MQEAVKLVHPSTREGFSPIPYVQWEDVVGHDSLRKVFDKFIIQRIKHPEVICKYYTFFTLLLTFISLRSSSMYRPIIYMGFSFYKLRHRPLKLNPLALASRRRLSLSRDWVITISFS